MAVRAEPSGLAICSQQDNATSCNYRGNCDWVPSPKNASEHVCQDVYCSHWDSSAACKKYAAIGCEWHPLKRTCAQITGGDLGSEQQAVPIEPQTASRSRRGAVQGRILGGDGPPFPTPPSLGCGGWNDSAVDCRVSGHCPGTLDDYHHLFLPNARLWAHENTTGVIAQKELGSRLCRLFNPSATEVSGEGTLRYWEAVVGGAPLYPDGIKFVIGNFPELFGTPGGQQLRDWCISRGWVLIWALGAAGQNVQAEWFGQPPTYALFNQRTLDPIVLAATTVGNVSSITTTAIQSKFGQLWGFIENYRETHAPAKPVPGNPIPPPEFNVSVYTYWFENQPKGLLVAPLTGSHGCGDDAADQCVGTLASDESCVCYTTAAE